MWAGCGERERGQSIPAPAGRRGASGVAMSVGSAPPAAAAAAPLPLLCERCGYVLDGLGASAACPECGLDVAESLPGRRGGTPWQRRPSGASWRATNAAVLRRPRELFGGATMERRRSLRLAHINIALAAVVIAVGWTVQVGRLGGEPGLLAGMAWFALAIVGPAAAVLMWLGMWIESVGIRFFGRRRGWRITSDVAWAVCGHASIGWTIAGLLWVAGALASWGLGLRGVSRPAPNVVVINHVSPWSPMLLGLLAGLLVFEVLVNIGLRRCRYTNPGG